MTALKKIRIGTDVITALSVNISGKPVTWSEGDIHHVYAFSDVQGQPVAEMAHKAEGQTLRCTYAAKDQNYTGPFRVIVEFADGKAFSSSLDVPAFEIVRTTEEADADTGEVVLDIDGTMRFYSLSEAIAKIEGATKAATDAAAEAKEVSSGVAALERDLGQYAELPSVTMTAETTGKYINADGEFVDDADFNIAAIGTVVVGNTYELYMGSAANMKLGVALFVARIKTTTTSGTERTEYVPLFSAMSTDIPTSGYVCFEAMDAYSDVLVCYRTDVPEAATLLVRRYGTKASIATQINNLRKKVDLKSFADGYYESMRVGTADNLTSKGDATEEVIMSRKAGGDNQIEDGSASIKRIKGYSFVLNQSTGPETPWYPVFGTMTKTGISISYTYGTVGIENLNQNRIATRFFIGDKHKYLICFQLTTSKEGESFIECSSNAHTNQQTYTAKIGVNKIAVILTAIGTGESDLRLGLPANDTINVGDTVSIEDIMLLDLTQMFGIGNEPSTPDNFAKRLGYSSINDVPYIPYNEGEIVSSFAEGIKTTDTEGKVSERKWSETLKKYFPDGLKSVGSAFDEITPTKAVKRVEMIPIVNLTWTSKTTHDGNNYYECSRRCTSNVIVTGYNRDTGANIYYGKVTNAYGVLTEYNALLISDTNYIDDLQGFLNNAKEKGLVLQDVVAMPEEYTYDELNLTEQVAEGGTEEAIITDGKTSTPLRADIVYPIDAYNTIKANKANIGTLSSLNTASKSDLVSAINELAGKVTGLENYDDTQVRALIAGKQDKLTPITYAELIALRDSSSLVAGTQYRITDYDFTTTEADTDSAHQLFDIIVTADSESVLNETARAAHHQYGSSEETLTGAVKLYKTDMNGYADEVDTGDYFLLAGTVEVDRATYYRYDKYEDGVNTGRYILLESIDLDSLGIGLDNPLYPVGEGTYGEDGSYMSHSEDAIVAYENGALSDDPLLLRDIASWELKYTLNNTKHSSSDGKGTVLWMKDEFRNECNYDFINALFKVYEITACAKSPSLVGTYAIKTDSSNITYGTNSKLVSTFGGDNHDNVIKYDGLAKIVLGNGCNSNIFGNDCHSNTFGNDCHSNTFGNTCNSNTFGNNCNFHTFGNNCSSNIFGNDCHSNTFGNDCHSNTFGNTCNSNTFGNNCNFHTFGNNCNSNTFGNDCYSNIFGNNCNSNTFGNNCNFIKFAFTSSAMTKYNYYRNNYFGDGCQYLLFKGAGTESSSTQVQNYNFAQGLQGTLSEYLTIDGVRSRAYETKVAKNSSGELKIYCEADFDTTV